MPYLVNLRLPNNKPENWVTVGQNQVALPFENTDGFELTYKSLFEFFAKHGIHITADESLLNQRLSGMITGNAAHIEIPESYKGKLVIKKPIPPEDYAPKTDFLDGLNLRTFTIDESDPNLPWIDPQGDDPFKE